MARSDNPFENLPEWRERRRLQELQAGQQPQFDAEPPTQEPYQQSLEGYPQANEQDYAQPQFPAGYNGGQPVYSETDYGVGQVPEPGHQQPQTGTGQPSYGGQEPQFGAPATPQYYDQNATAPSLPQYYGEPQQGDAYPAPGSSYPGEQITSHEAPDLRQGFDLSAPPMPQQQGYGEFDPYPADPASAPLPNYDLGQPSDQQAPYPPDPQLDPMFQQPAVQSRLAGGVGAAVGGGLVASGQAADQGLEPDDDDDDEEYYDDEDEEQRFSWKLAAAVIVTGAVVTGGGVVLYDSFKSGGLNNGSGAPIIKAEGGPAKTAPATPGGRQFANRDSKLLGRLDNGSGARTSAQLSDGDDRSSRVRTVPTVRIGRDGQFIPPKAPQAVPAPAAPASGGQETQTMPGINVVDTLNGGSRLGGQGALPPALPKTNSPAIQSARAAPTVPAAKQAAAALRQTAQPEVSTVPVIKNRGATNRATQPNSGPPPVPSKSAVGTAWRMEGPATSTAQRAPQRSAPVARQRQVRAAPSSVPSQPRRTGSLAPPAGASSGYVAVLATAPSRMRALQSFAELQQKHPAALRDRVPAVQRADLKSRGLGIMYRIVVGPAASRSAANSVCTSLKAEGYKGCWVKAN